MRGVEKEEGLRKSRVLGLGSSTRLQQPVVHCPELGIAHRDGMHHCRGGEETLGRETEGGELYS